MESSAVSGSAKTEVGSMCRGDTPEEWLRHRTRNSSKASLSTVKPGVPFCLESDYLAKTYCFAGVRPKALNQKL